MSRPILSNNLFTTDQIVNKTVTVYNTPHTVSSKGMYYRPATPSSTFGNSIAFSSATDIQLDTHFDANTIPGIVDSSGSEVYGRVPVIYDYWGSQAPLGVSKAGTVAIRIIGYVKETGTYGFSVHGKGNIKIFHEGSSIIYGSFNELSPKYSSSMHNLTAGDEIKIFYWGKNLDWGGLAIRVFTDSDIITSGSLDWDLLRESEFISSSFMDSGESVTSVDVDLVDKLEIDVKSDQLSTASFSVVSSRVNNLQGWSWDHTNKKLINVETNETIKIGELVKITGGITGDIHPLFTGHVVDIVPNKDTISITCNSLETRLVQQLSENYPDLLAYAAFGYTDRSGVENPVWGVPAYDHWPYEYALKDMLTRAWIDNSLFSGTSVVKRVGETTTEAGENLFKCRGLSGGLIRVQRQPNYGNPYDDPDLNPDDPYLTSSELTQTLYARITDLVKRIGYDFRTDPRGYFVLLPKNNPSSISDITGGTSITHPSCIGGIYQKYTGTGWSVSINNVKASRLELVVGIGPSLGTIDVSVERQEDLQVTNIQIDTSYDTEYFYYDKVLTSDLINITTFTLIDGEDYGTYDITITPHGVSPTTEHRLDALRIFEKDPIVPISDFSLSNFKNITELTGKSNATERINDAIVTGVRKSAITDSGKTLDKISSEFVVSRSTDLNAIYNPNSTNFDGRKITAYLSNESIADQDLADWTSRTLVSRYRVPEPDLKVVHTILPVIELRDPLYVADESYNAFDPDNPRWIIGYKHIFDNASATTEMELTSFQEIPSYEPREEIDISNYNNKPIINLNITYPSLDGSSTISNPLTNLVQPSTITTTSGTIAYDTNYYLVVNSGTMSPGSELLRIYSAGGTDAQALNRDLNYDMQFFKNNPYHKFYEKTGSRLDLVWECADGSSPYSITNWGVDGISIGDSAEFSFRPIQNVYSGAPPFYDPYYSELAVPELVDISFDALISGYYRVSIVDARGKNPITVAWLTKPSAESIDGESHWEYINAGSDKSFTWDGVDNLGIWNRTHSEEYSWRQKGNFDSVESPLIGKGFLAFNDQTTAISHISHEMDSGEVVYPVGKYAQFFVRIEVLRNTNDVPLLVESNNSDDLLDSSASTLDERYIYYHLPTPNKVSISIEDWDDSYTYTTGGSHWTTVSPDAIINNEKPVKISITPKARLGAKFNDDITLTNVKVNRCVHLSTQILDQIAIMHGEQWNSKASSERKTLSSRRTSDDTHTIIYSDNGFVSGDDISSWIFYPSLFEKDFGKGKESIRFRDYLQLQEIPSWNPERRTGEERSRFLLGLMGYLFYFSVYTQDRSGRLVWAVDESFVDKSKILNNTDTTEFPKDLERHQRRTVYVRQWWDYDNIDADLGTTWSVPQKHYGGYTDVWDYHHRVSDELFPINIASGTYVSGTVETSYQDPYSLAAYTANRLEFDDSITSATLYRDLGNASNTVLGSWTWETDGFLWIPDISRDFHPFYIVPPMGLCGYLVDASDGWTPWWEGHYWYAITESPPNKVADEAKNDSYFSTVYDYDTGTYDGDYIMIGGKNVLDVFKDSKGNPKTVPDNILQYQRQDDIKHYESSRGTYTNGPNDGRDIINVVGGDPYYLNTKLYRYFRMESRLQTGDGGKIKKTKYYNDVWRKGFFFVTFRHTYNWESATLFPTDINRYLKVGAIDADLTGSSVLASSYDPGAWVGWKDDHPSTMQEGVWKETGTCSALHWRNDYTNNGRTWGSSANSFDAQAGGSCSIEDPTVALTDEDLPKTYTPDKNIFLQKLIVVGGKATTLESNYMPLAVGPRLPQTRRLLLSMVLLNSRRSSSI